MKDIQIKKNQDYVLPEPVYRQVIWTLRDLRRIKKRLTELRELSYTIRGRDIGRVVLSNIVSDVTANNAVNISNLEMRINKIEEAFNLIPDKYREGIYNKLVLEIPYPDTFHINTWRKWQQILCYQVAVNLELL